MKLTLTGTKSQKASDRAITDYVLITTAHWDFDQIDKADPKRIMELLLVHNLVSKHTPPKKATKKPVRRRK